ncbi:MAG: DUF4468 domain-containing protein [Bacteroidales bacterium]|nr:DUF4468 domain-containing protein [Bacteroidales bacterium]
MKTYVLSFTLILLSTLIINAQKEEYKEPVLPIDSNTKMIMYSKTLSVNLTKDSLYKKVKSWFFAYYKNPTGVIRQDDAANGQIIGKHQIKVLNPPDKKGIQTMRGIVQYTITTQFKDNKVRIVLNELNLKETSYTPIEKWLDKTAPGFTTKNYFYLEQIDKEMKATINHFENYITKSQSTNKNEW